MERDQKERWKNIDQKAVISTVATVAVGVQPQTNKTNLELQSNSLEKCRTALIFFGIVQGTADGKGSKRMEENYRSEGWHQYCSDGSSGSAAPNTQDQLGTSKQLTGKMSNGSNLFWNS